MLQPIPAPKRKSPRCQFCGGDDKLFMRTAVINDDLGDVKQIQFWVCNQCWDALFAMFLAFATHNGLLPN